MKFHRCLLLLIVPIYLFSCATQHRLPNYLENLKDTTGIGEVNYPNLQIQKNDLLSIQVYSASTNKDLSDQPFNLPANSPGGGGFLVDVNGDIEYPRLGTIHAEGLTKQELAAEIKKRLTQPKLLLTDPTVIIRFLNFKVLMMGEVGKAGDLSVPGERLTILEAIAMAGGVTDYGKKDNVKIVRENNGKREIGTIDLSSKNIFQSPYYNLVQNDIVMVEPTHQKARQMDQNLVTQRISLALSLITAAAFIYNIFK